MSDVSFGRSGEQCRAWFERPSGHGPHALVILGHGFSGTRDVKLGDFAARFRAAGYATLVIEYRNFGDSDGHVRQHLNPWHEMEDWRAALRWAQAQPEVDPARIVLWGTSFGGGLVLSVAAGNPGVAATIAQCPMVDGLASSLAVMNYAGLPYTLRMVAHGVRDMVQSMLGRAPHYMPVIGLPGQIAAMSSPDAHDAFLRMLPANTVWQNRVTARTALYLPFYRPIARIKQVNCPVFFVICEQDSVAPAEAARQAARLTRKGQVLSLDCGHFEIYDGELLERSVAAQLAFLQAQVPA
jgi:dienelactone hydrolase